MKMKSQRKVEHDRGKREVARSRTRLTTEADGEAVDGSLGELDDQLARSLQGYDE